MRVGILGAGYTGRALASELIEAGHEVVAVGRNHAPLVALSAVHGERVIPRVASTTDRDALRAALDGVDRVVHLAPPPREAPPEDDAAGLAGALPRGCDRVVYGSTTGVFVRPDPAREGEGDGWVDEDTPAGPSGRLGRQRYAYERALLDLAPSPVHIVRIPGIYGPGRTLADKLLAGDLLLFEGGSVTSRIHRDDLARILAAMVLSEAPPPLVLACDDLPAKTLEVARFTARLLGMPPPAVLSREQAEAQMSEMAKELRLHGKRCRSLYRADLIGPLRYPSYREGVAASLEEEGRIPARPGSRP